VAQFTAQYSSFTEVLEKLQEEYHDLSERYSSLQSELEDANRQLRAAVAERAQAAAYLESILRSISSGVISVDLEGRIQHFNRGAEQIFGKSAESVLGSRYGDVLPAEGPSAQAALRGPRAVCDGEKIYSDPQGKTRPLAVSTAILTDSEGKVQGAVEIVNDLSRLRFLESEVTRVRTLAALGEMSATVAHEIRNPLGGIVGFAGLLARDLEPGNPQRALAEKIVRGCENLNRIVTNLLQYAQPLKLERRHCDIKTELAEELVMFEEELKRQRRAIRIERAFCGRPVEGFADPVQLRLALHNLLLNAADAVGSGGITCGLNLNDDHEGPGHVDLWVADDGPGVPEAHRERVFTPFFTTKDKGTGLGLATVRKVCEAHRGRVTLHHPPQGGARFELRIPLS
jgi:PAS domain S-box-containing protein